MGGAGEEQVVLVVEDSDAIRAFLKAALEQGGYRVEQAADGAEGVRRFEELRPALLVLDIQMPELDGWEVLERVRLVDRDVPVIMLTASEVTDRARARGLAAGADDYVVKPVGPSELLARARVLLRRTQATTPGYSDGVLRLDFDAERAWAGGAEVPLSPLEFRLLAALVRGGGEVLGARRLAADVWKDERETTVAAVATYVDALRVQLSRAGGDLIEAVDGAGWRYAGVDQPAPLAEGAL